MLPKDHGVEEERSFKRLSLYISIKYSIKYKDFCFGFHRQLRFCLFTHVWVSLCMNMFHPNVPCFCHHSIPVCSRRLSIAIHQHIFSRLAGAQFIVCMTYPTLQTFLFRFLQIIAFSPVYLYLSFNTSQYVSLPCFIHLLSFHSSVLSRATMDRHPKESAPLSWCVRAI